jgi:hypothetical protein
MLKSCSKIIGKTGAQNKDSPLDSGEEHMGDVGLRRRRATLEFTMEVQA